MFIIDHDDWALKAIAAASFIQSLQFDNPESRFAYTMPRYDLTGLAVARAIEHYAKDCVFFGEANFAASEMQRSIPTYGGCEMRFYRTGSIHFLQAKVREWCTELKSPRRLIPMHLLDEPAVVASIALMGDLFTTFHGGEPPAFYCAAMRGTTLQGLRIAWPRAAAHGYGVLGVKLRQHRVGKAKIFRSDLDYFVEAEPPPFPTSLREDAKAYWYFLEHAEPGSVFINTNNGEVRKPHVNLPPLQPDLKWDDETAFTRDLTE